MKKSRHYILKNGKVVPCELITWARWFQTGERIVKQELVGNAKVSTVFLGLDHGGWNDNDPPVLWETMVFGGTLNNEMSRCAGNREQAEAMHNDMVERVKAVEALHEHEANKSQG